MNGGNPTSSGTKAQALTILPNQNIDLILLGDGERISILKLLVKQNNLEGKVHFLGHQENPYTYLKNAKIKDP